MIYCDIKQIPLLSLRYGWVNFQAAQLVCLVFKIKKKFNMTVPVTYVINKLLKAHALNNNLYRTVK